MEGYAALGNLLPIIAAELWPHLGGLVPDDPESPDKDDAPLTWAEVQGFQIAPDVGAAARQQQDAAFDEFWAECLRGRQLRRSLGDLADSGRLTRQPPIGGGTGTGRDGAAADG